MKFIVSLTILMILGCEGVDFISIEDDVDLEACGYNPVLSQGKYYTIGDKQYLYGGSDSTTHFDITGWTLNSCYLDNGLGREAFQALIEPTYTPLSSVNDQYHDSSGAVLLLTEGKPKVYPLSTLRQHEVINEVVKGVPVMIVYCYIADLVSVYKRQYCGNKLTFAVSGYTYRDPNNFGGLESFILWDRNTESLWWPIIDRGVSGFFRGSALTKYNFREWGETTIGEIREKYPEAVVIDRGQTVNIPSNIPKIDNCN